jgi:hypothetical protein
MMTDGNLPHEVVVLTFKAVYTLEVKRHENDKRVLALYAEYVASNLNLSPPSHKFQNERHDGSSPQVPLYSCPTGFLPDRPLSSLDEVSDPGQVASDGQTVAGRMQKLCEAVAEDIKKCANACDTYLK